METTTGGCIQAPRAQQWAAEFQQHGRLEHIEDALDGLLERDTPSGEDACVALAAAEVVAAMHGRAAADFPEDLKHWVTGHNQGSDPERLSERASAAVVRVVESPELREASRPPGGRDRWVARLRDLDARLQRPGA